MTRALPRLLSDLLRAARWHRRLLAAGLAAAAVALALQAAAPNPPPRTAVVLARRDLPAGAAVGTSDVSVVLVPEQSAPAAALRRPEAAIGRVLVSPVRRGEALTDVRLVGSALLAALPAGMVAAPVRLADASVVRLLRVGDVVDIVAATGSTAGTGGAATVVAPASRIMVVPGPGERAETAEGALIVAAVETSTALALARAAMYARLSVLLRPG